MNDINELVKIIEELGGKATAEQITAAYCRKYHIVMQPSHKNTVKVTLGMNKDLVLNDPATREWYVRGFEGRNSYYVSDNVFLPGSPEWFRMKSEEPQIQEIQEKHDVIRKQFEDSYAPSELKKMDGGELLEKVFRTEKGLMYLVMLDGSLREFGAGSKFPYIWPLRYEKNGNTCTMYRNSKGTELSMTDAEVKASEIRDQLIKCTDAIEQIGEFDTIQAYIQLENKVKNVYFSDHLWAVKYFQMIYPESFPQMYADKFVKRCIVKFGLEWHGGHKLLNYGEIALFTRRCGIPNDSFKSIFAEQWGWDNKDMTPCEAVQSQQKVE